MDTRHAILLVCVLACGRAPHPTPAADSVVLAGPTIPAESARVAATDSFGVAIARRLAPGVNVRIVTDREALDLIDSGGDALVTDRAAVIRYASSRADFLVIALPWDRQYAMLAGLPLPVPDVLDAVHADARVAQQHCPVENVSVHGRAPIAYLADDSIARSLAERIVGLGVGERAVPVGHARVPGDTWLIVSRPIDGAPCDLDHWHAVPLIDTRSHLIVRRGSVGVVADAVDSVRLEITP